MPLNRSSILVVCEGNICRSPLGALLLAGFGGGATGLDVASAGLRAVVGSGMDGKAAQQAQRFGLDPSPHIARLLTESMIDEAAVILAMTVEQRTRVIQLSPLAMRRTFTIKEFALAAEAAPASAGTGAEVLRSIVKWGDQARASQKDRDLDVDDPYRRDDAVHIRVADEIHAACKAIARGLGQ